MDSALTRDHAPDAPRRPHMGRAALFWSFLLLLLTLGCRASGAGARSLDEDFFSRTEPGEEAALVAATVDFGDAVRLLGFDLLSTRDGPVLVTYWTGLRHLDRAPVLWPFFYDEGNGTVLSPLPAAALPALSMVPLDRWQPGHVVRLAMHPVALGERRDAGVGVAVLEEPDPSAPRLLPRLGGATAIVRPIAGGTAVEIARIRGGDPAIERHLFELPAVEQPASVTFGDFAQLRGYDLRRDGDALLLTAYWQTLQPTDANLMVRATLLDDAGRALSQAESVPRVGQYPTDRWLPGEIVIDSYRLPVPEGFEPRRVALSFFDPASGRSLQARDDQGALLPDDRATFPVEAAP